MYGGHGVFPVYLLLKQVQDGKHPWQTPTVFLKNSCSLLFKKTALLEFSYSAWMAWTSPSSMQKLLRTCHRSACQTVNNFSKSMKLWNRLRWFCRCWTIEDLFCCALAWSEPCLLFCVCCRCFSMIAGLLKICSTLLWPGLKSHCSFVCVVDALLWYLDYWRSILLCSGLV